jgi:hypothetical protein
MNSRIVLERVRIILTCLAALLFAGTVAELIALKHYDELTQKLPFLLCALGLVALALSWRQLDPRWIAGIWIAMGVTIVGSLFGLWEHLEGNAEFYKEIHPHATTRELLNQAVTGRNPMMAPGILAVAAILTLVVLHVNRALLAPEPAT